MLDDKILAEGKSLWPFTKVRLQRRSAMWIFFICRRALMVRLKSVLKILEGEVISQLITALIAELHILHIYLPNVTLSLA